MDSDELLEVPDLEAELLDAEVVEAPLDEDEEDAELEEVADLDEEDVVLMVDLILNRPEKLISVLVN